MKREYTMITTLANGTTLAPVTRKSEEAMSNYANRMFAKYGEEITVDVYCETSMGDFFLYTTYHA